MCLNGTAWAQALSKAGAIMLLSLIQTQQPYISSCRRRWAPSPFPSLVREAHRKGRLVAAGECWWHSPLPTTGSPVLSWGCLPAQSKISFSVEILILLGTGEAAAAGAVQPSDPRGSNPCRMFPLPQHSSGLLRG